MLTDKAPYVITLVVAALAWTLTHTVDRLLATPLLTYEIASSTTEDGDKRSTFTFINITRDKTYYNLRVLITAPADGVIKSGPILPVQPASEGDKPPSIAGRTFDFTFPEFQPQWQFSIPVVYSGQGETTLRLSLPQAALYAVNPSVQTSLVQHEFGVMMTLIVIWIVVLTGWGIYAWRHP